MKDTRLGDDLWQEWDGSGVEEERLTYYTKEHTSIENELVRRALASALQKDGVAVSLGEGYKMIETAKIIYGFAGYLAGEKELIFCDEGGETDHGDLIVNIVSITWIVL